MKYLFYLSILFLRSSAMGQSLPTDKPSEKVIIDNDQMKVVEFVSMPQKDVCGVGIHQHKPHLTVLLSDVKVQITAENGESQIIEAPSGTSLWSEDETHSVINLGDQPTRMILVFPKE